MRHASLLLHGDVEAACSALPMGRELDLVYLDPPYGVGVTMAARTRKGEARGRKQARSGPDAYADALPIDELAAMVARAAASIRDRMAPHAALFLHMDQRAVHETKVACDAVFGRSAFAGEVVWEPGNGARGRGIPTTHQTILIYARRGADRAKLRWDASSPLLREPFAETSLAMHFKRRDADGRLYRERVIGGKAYRYYADEGRRLGSVWTDIPAMIANTPIHGEGTGYPTQKPVRLLERIVVAASAPGETVADLMCGSGTTLVAAARNGRAFIGGDASPLAIRTTKMRLGAEGIVFEDLTSPRKRAPRGPRP